MTNIEGLETLFVMIVLLVACIVVTVLLGAVIGRRRKNGDTGGRTSQVGTVLAVVAIGLSILSWVLALVFVTPAGMIERLGRGNPVLIGMLLGYTAPAVVGGYLLWKLRSTEAASHAA